jgi:molybdate transport system substrate-binding protein
MRVAVAANFAGVARKIASAFDERTGSLTEVSSGSTGHLFAQIRHGAPYVVFLSADQDRARRLEDLGQAKKGSRFTYALGRLALYGRALSHPSDGLRDLKAGAFSRLALANPRTAPYGAAARQVLAKLGLEVELRSRVVQGENVTRTLQYLQSGAAELGFVSLAQVKALPEARYFVVPRDWHQPIRQDAVILNGGGRSAVGFTEYLRGPEARQLISAAGYDVP